MIPTSPQSYSVRLYGRCGVDLPLHSAASDTCRNNSRQVSVISTAHKMCPFIVLGRMNVTMPGESFFRNLGGVPQYPCRVNAVPRPIPEKRWFMEPPVIIALGGVSYVLI